MDTNGAAWTVEAASDPLGDNDLYVQFEYTQENCEVGIADGSGWAYLSSANETDTVVGVYDIGGANTPITSVYAEFDYGLTSFGFTATITLNDVNVWVNADVDGNYAPAPDKSDDPDAHPDVLPAPGPGAGAIQVITGHEGVGEALVEPQEPEQPFVRCEEGDPAVINSDFHAEVQGEIQILQS